MEVWGGGTKSRTGFASWLGMGREFAAVTSESARVINLTYQDFCTICLEAIRDWMSSKGTSIKVPHVRG